MTTPTPAPDLSCPVCGTVNPASRQFCRRCAADLRAPIRNPSDPAEPPPAPVPIRPIVLGVGAALVVLVALMVLLFALGGSPTATPTPTPVPTPTPSTDVTDTPTLPPTATPTSPPTQAPTIVPPPTPSGPPPSEGAGSPVVDTLTGPRRASCTGTNGTDTPGYIHLEWTASNTTGVRLSIDPPAPNDAYDYGYADYAADDKADVPFTCDPPNSDANGAYHLYVVTTLHDNGHFAWRLIRVYIRD